MRKTVVVVPLIIGTTALVARIGGPRAAAATIVLAAAGYLAGRATAHEGDPYAEP